MLASGLITLIAIAPVHGITPRTRLTAGAIGGTLVLASVALASIPSFRYPAIVMVAPVIALLSVAAVVGKALRGHSPLQAGHQGHNVHPAPDEPPGTTESVPHHETGPNIPASLSPAELMEYAARDHRRWVEVARHPSAYPALLDWLHQYGSAEVRTAG